MPKQSPRIKKTRHRYGGWRIVRPTEHRFKKGHPHFGPTTPLTDDEKAVRKIKEQIMKQYGWRRIRDLTFDQKAYLEVEARAWYRLLKQPLDAPVSDFGQLSNIGRRA